MTALISRSIWQARLRHRPTRCDRIVSFCLWPLQTQRHRLSRDLSADLLCQEHLIAPNALVVLIPKHVLPRASKKNHGGHIAPVASLAQSLVPNVKSASFASLTDTPPTLNFTLDQLNVAWQAVIGFVLSRTAPELGSALLATIALPVLLMTLSGRRSPFSASPDTDGTPNPCVRDADFSYITSDQVKRGDYDGPSDPPRDTDLLILRDRTKTHVVHFPAHSIDREELTIGQLRQQAARKILHAGAAPRRIQLFHKGKNLKHDDKSCRSEGIRQGYEILCTLAEPASSSSNSDSHDASSDPDTSRRAPTKRKKRSGKRSKPKIKTSAMTQGPAEVLPTSSKNTSRAGSPMPGTQTPPVSVPKTPSAALTFLSQTLDAQSIECNDFKSDPPSVAAKRDFEHKRLSESILAQVLLKLDAIETEDPDLRFRRKELVRKAQAELKGLDDFMHQ